MQSRCGVVCQGIDSQLWTDDLSRHEYSIADATCNARFFVSLEENFKFLGTCKKLFFCTKLVQNDCELSL